MPRSTASRPDRKAPGSAMLATSAVASAGPTPGIASSRLLVAFCSMPGHAASVELQYLGLQCRQLTAENSKLPNVSCGSFAPFGRVSPISSLPDIRLEKVSGLVGKGHRRTHASHREHSRSDHEVSPAQASNADGTVRLPRSTAVTYRCVQGGRGIFDVRQSATSSVQALFSWPQVEFAQVCSNKAARLCGPSGRFRFSRSVCF